jgi:hypothetical protein
MDMNGTTLLGQAEAEARRFGRSGAVAIEH